jgi:hypothetical protein
MKNAKDYQHHKNYAMNSDSSIYLNKHVPDGFGSGDNISIEMRMLHV